MAEGAAVPDEADSARRERLPDAGVVVDPRGVVVALSKGACRLLGCGPADVVGRAAAELLTEPLPLALRHSCAQRLSWSGHVTVRHRDGDRLALAVQARPLVDTAGEAYWFLTVARLEPYAPSPGDGDAPDTALLKQWALDQLPLPMALYDRSGVRIEINAAMTREAGKPDHDLLGRPVGHSASGRTVRDSKGIAEALKQVVATGEPATTELHGMGPGDAARRVWLLSLYPVRDPGGRICGVSAAAVDTTEQFRARRRMSILHEAGLRIGTTLDLGRTADEPAEVSTDHFADFAVVDLLGSVLRGEESAARDRMLVLRRTAQRSVLPGCPESVVTLGETYT